MLFSRHARRLRATTVVALVGIAFALVLAGCAGSEGTPQTSSQPSGHGTTHVSTVVRAGGNVATQMRTFTPFRPGGAPASGVAAHRSGSCFTTSITVATHDAYRCLAGNALLDPCFARSDSAHVLFCYSAPWSAATRLHLTKPLPGETHQLRVTFPWAIQLAGNVRCIASGGTTEMKRGIPLSYQCGTGEAGLYPSHAALRKALFSGHNGSLHDVNVAVEWRG